VTDEQLLAQCKIGLNIQESETAFDDVLAQKIAAVKSFMGNAGVSVSMLSDDAAVEAIVLGVTDIWNTDPGVVKFSAVFVMMVTQLAASSGVLTVASSPADGAAGVSVAVAPALTFSKAIGSYSIGIYEYASKDQIATTDELDITEKVLSLIHI
jgi:hypothetical protein